MPGELAALTPTPRQEEAQFSDAERPEVPGGSAGQLGKASRGSRQPRGQVLVERGIGSALLSTALPPLARGCTAEARRPYLPRGDQAVLKNELILLRFCHVNLTRAMRASHTNINRKDSIRHKQQ